MYKAVLTSDAYLIHYNKNHSKSNGQFTSGDGDGDGIANDHANQRKERSSGQNLRNTIDANKRKLRTGKGLIMGSIGLDAIALAAGTAWQDSPSPLFAATALIAGAGSATMTIVGGVMASKASGEIKKAANKVIDEHYDAPLTEAWEELNR